MSNRIVQLAVAVATIVALHADLSAAPKKRPARPVHRTPPPASLPCGDLVGFQVLLDRQGFSPGQIDGKTGANFSHVLAAFQAARNLAPTSAPPCETWQALGGDAPPQPTITEYTLTDADVKGPFEKQIPRRLADQAKLDSLGYQSATELIAE